MIDIHCHILPGVDDGARDLEESIEMARLAVMEGITDIIATPHHANGRWMNEGEAVRAGVELLNQALTEHGIPLTVNPGQEIRIYRELLDDYQDGKLLGLNHSPYMLIELPTGSVPSYTESLLHECRVEGIIPVIAHPERNMELTRHPEMLFNWIEAGALCQVTSHSINGLFGSKIQALAMDWCRMNLVHFIASDAHNVKQRAFQLSSAYKILNKELGEDYTSYYKDNTVQLFHAGPIDIWEPVALKKKWFHLWRR